MDHLVLPYAVIAINCSAIDVPVWQYLLPHSYNGTARHLRVIRVLGSCPGLFSVFRVNESNLQITNLQISDLPLIPSQRPRTFRPAGPKPPGG